MQDEKDRREEKREAPANKTDNQLEMSARACVDYATYPPEVYRARLDEK